MRSRLCPVKKWPNRTACRDVLRGPFKSILVPSAAARVRWRELVCSSELSDVTLTPDACLFAVARSGTGSVGCTRFMRERPLDRRGRDDPPWRRRSARSLRQPGHGQSSDCLRARTDERTGGGAATAGSRLRTGDRCRIRPAGFLPRCRRNVGSLRVVRTRLRSGEVGFPRLPGSRRNDGNRTVCVVRTTR
jgi:hypothetical protein